MRLCAVSRRNDEPETSIIAPNTTGSVNCAVPSPMPSGTLSHSVRKDWGSAQNAWPGPPGQAEIPGRSLPIEGRRGRFAHTSREKRFSVGIANLENDTRPFHLGAFDPLIYRNPINHPLRFPYANRRPLSQPANQPPCWSKWEGSGRRSRCGSRPRTESHGLARCRRRYLAVAELNELDADQGVRSIGRAGAKVGYGPRTVGVLDQL